MKINKKEAGFSPFKKKKIAKDCKNFAKVAKYRQIWSHWVTKGTRTRVEVEKGLKQFDQIGRFLKVLGNKIACKSRPNIKQQFWAILKNCTF